MVIQRDLFPAELVVEQQRFAASHGYEQDLPESFFEVGEDFEDEVPEDLRTWQEIQADDAGIPLQGPI